MYLVCGVFPAGLRRWPGGRAALCHACILRAARFDDVSLVCTRLCFNCMKAYVFLWVRDIVVGVRAGPIAPMAKGPVFQSRSSRS